MLYYLFEYLREAFQLPGANVFQYITFRAAMAVITSLLISLVFGKKLIEILRKKQVGESIRDLGLDGQMEKKRYTNNGGYYHYRIYPYTRIALYQTQQHLYNSYDIFNYLVGYYRFY
jgi:hypothetical protein